MADDAQNDAQPREPRTAVDAAGDPAHGGGVPASVFDEHNESFWPAEKIAQSTSEYGRPGFVTPPLSTDNAPPPRTILSGVERLRKLAAEGRDLAGGLMEHVLSMAGSADGMPEKDDGEPGPDVSTNNMHRAIDEIETAFSVLGRLLARAKAAHG